MVNRISVFSQADFDIKMWRMNISDENVERETDKAFISIIGTPDCLNNYLHEETYHWFQKNTDNVLNMEFDDVNDDQFLYKGTTFLGISEDQAKKCVEFIERNKGRNFYIHCRAGKSRSQAICRFILDMYGEEYGYTEKESCLSSNPPKTPNIRVLTMLKREFYKLHNMFEEK